MEKSIENEIKWNKIKYLMPNECIFINSYLKYKKVFILFN